MSLRALFPVAFLVCHDCIPNTGHIDQDYHMIVRNSVPLKAGDPITLSYALTLQPTFKRREHLKESKFFECVCSRCSDPTESGTYLSAMKCQKCNDGLVLSTDPLKADAIWKCNSTQCTGFSLTADDVNVLMERIQKEVNAAGDDIEALEFFLKQYKNILHKHHYCMLGIKYSLSQLYGKCNGYLIHELTEEQLNRKKEICEDLLSVFNVIEPGMSRIRAITMYELHAPIMIQLTRQFQMQNISKRQLKLDLKRVVNYLQEASNILSFEPEDSAEGEMCMAANDALERLQDWEEIIGKL
uniref:SET domain-containing protein n=3 Tax=Clastoptera arizonana TaxID=38151 RepID=A0A1B6C0V1_9HEMI